MFDTIRKVSSVICMKCMVLSTAYLTRNHAQAENIRSFGAKIVNELKYWYVLIFTSHLLNTYYLKNIFKVNFTPLKYILKYSKMR